MKVVRNIVIRPLERNDASEVSRIIVENLRLVNVVDYGTAAVEQLALFYTPEWLLRYAQSCRMFVAEVNANIVGTVALENEHARMLFVRVDNQRQGIGTLLMQHIEETACGQHNQRLTLLANVGAVDFYLRLGYAQIEKKEIPVGEAQIAVVAMEKTLLIA